jgi:hypothetical protein
MQFAIAWFVLVVDLPEFWTRLSVQFFWEKDTGEDTNFSWI